MSLSQSIALLLCLILAACVQPNTDKQALGPPYTAEGNRIYDLEGIINSKDSIMLNELFLAHERKTSNQIALVTTDTLAGYKDMAQFATFYFSDLGLGREDLNNGVGIAFSQELRGCFIATGIGTEVVMGDEIVSRIVDSLMTPEFKANRYTKGLQIGTEALVNFLERPENRMDIQPK